MVDERARAHTGFTVSRTRLLLVLLYFIVASAVLMYFHVGLVPDVLIPVFLGAAFIVGRSWLFLRDWGVFLLIVVLWQQTGPVAQWAGFPLHMNELVAADRWLAWPLLHGQLPQLWLQQHLYHPQVFVRTVYHAAHLDASHHLHKAYFSHKVYPPRFQWYDIMAAVTYGLHFPEPLAVGFLIWLRDRALFRRFATAFLTLAGIAFVIYIVYPAVPPWMASDPTFHGRRFGAVSPQIIKIFDDFNYWVQKKAFGHAYFKILDVKYNLTAAMPSLHAAFPVLSALYLYKAFGRWGLLMLAYAAVMWFSVVYLGEHWMIDVIVGLVCAILSYVAVEGVARWRIARAAARAAVAIPTHVAPPAVPVDGAASMASPGRVSDRGAR